MSANIRHFEKKRAIYANKSDYALRLLCFHQGCATYKRRYGAHFLSVIRKYVPTLRGNWHSLCPAQFANGTDPEQLCLMLLVQVVSAERPLHF